MFCRNLLILLSIALSVNCETLTASAVLASGNITGTVHFAEGDNGVQVTGSIVGLPAGLYGFHVHELGDISTCDAAGAHFNPNATDHGGRDHAVRHVGDLGNIQFIGEGDSATATINFVDNVIALSGPNSILRRTLVLHEQMDDLGLGGHETSLTTGNAGARVACGLILVRDAGNSVGAIVPSIVMLLLAGMFYISM